MNTPTVGTPLSYSPSTLGLILNGKLAEWQRLLQSGAQLQYSYEKTWAIPDTPPTDSFVTPDPLNPMDAVSCWRNKVYLSSEEIRCVEAAYAEEMNDPAKYWEDKYRLQRLNLRLLRQHLPQCLSVSPSSSTQTPLFVPTFSRDPPEIPPLVVIQTQFHHILPKGTFLKGRRDEGTLVARGCPNSQQSPRCRGYHPDRKHCKDE